MNICLIGNGLSPLILATILANRNIKVSIFEEYKPKINFIKHGCNRHNLIAELFD